MNNNKLIVWWLSANNFNPFKGIKYPKNFPKYIFEELHSLLGRNGRGRLWINCAVWKKNERHQIITISEKYWNTPLAEYLAEFCGGIVIKKSDYKYVKNFPGIFTDLKLKRI